MRNYLETNLQILSDIIKTVDDHPDAFSADLFRATSVLEDTADGAEEVVTALESSEREIEYGEAEDLRVFIIPPGGELARFIGLDSGVDGFLKKDELPTHIICNKQDVPVRSIIEWNESAPENSISRKGLYVETADGIGEAPRLCMIYACLPVPDDKV